jgi:hypothetical protein
MAAKKSVKKSVRKKKITNWGCPNAGRAFDLDTVRNMLQNTSSGFAAFFFPVMKEAMNNNPAAKACVDSYLAPTDQELMELGIPASGVGSKKRCTDSALLLAVIAEQNATSKKKKR